MLHNDLSNHMAPLILFSFDNVICDKVTKKFFRYSYELNHQVVAAVNSLYRKDFRIVYVTFEWPDKKLDDLEKELDFEGCLYSGVIKVKDIDGLYQFLKRNGGNYYDRDKDKVNTLFPFAIEWKDYLIQVWNKG